MLPVWLSVSRSHANKYIPTSVFQVSLGELVPPRFLPPLVSKENLWKQTVAQVDKGHRFFTGLFTDVLRVTQPVHGR